MHCLVLLVSSVVLLASALTPPALAGPILNEVCYDGVGADADEVFTEILGTPGLSLAGWSLLGINGSDGSAYQTITLGAVTIPSDGLLVLATSGATGTVLLARDVVANVDWQNGPDAVQLLDPRGGIVDALQYGDARQFNAGEGLYAPDVLAGWSLSRDVLGVDTNDNAADFWPTSAPTPGAGPAPAAPEPATLLLLGAGCVGLALRRRRSRGRVL